MFTISQLAKRFGLSRSTLLYYDAKGLLSPSGRSSSGYRLYSEASAAQLQKIDLFRKAGVPLARIKILLKNNPSDTSRILKDRLLAMNEEIRQLRDQQQIIIRLLNDRSLIASSRSIGKEQWVRILRHAGLDESGMLRWHQEFERTAPEAHKDFLESLGLSNAEVSRIRAHSR